jgi:hypothetical protein
MSDREIARLLHVSHTYVAATRRMVATQAPPAGNFPLAAPGDLTGSQIAALLRLLDAMSVVPAPVAILAERTGIAADSIAEALQLLAREGWVYCAGEAGWTKPVRREDIWPRAGCEAA